MENKSFFLILLTLVVLIVVALWQFYSLAWAGNVEHPHATTSSPVRHPHSFAAISSSASA
ncbi:MAG: hypothetical protein ACM3II_02400 [Rhodospirillaceae bacterium]